MRYTLAKPMLILAIVLLIFGAIFVYWLGSGPARAAGGQRGPGTIADRQAKVDQLIRQIDNQ